MLHKVLLRLSLFIGLFCFIIGKGINIYKKDIIILDIQRNIKEAVIKCEDVSGFFTMKMKINKIEIK